MAKVYWIDKDALALADMGSDRRTLTGPSAGTLSLHVSRHDSPFVSADNGASASGVRIETGMLESPVLPVEYHEAICYKAIAHGYEKRLETLPQAKYFLSKFEKAIADGKQEANSHKSDESSVVIVGREF